MFIGSNILITGTNRGIGLGLVKEFLKHDEVKHIFAAFLPEHVEDSKNLPNVLLFRLIFGSFIWSFDLVVLLACFFATVPF